MRGAPLLFVIALPLAGPYERARDEEQAMHFAEALRDYEAAAADPASKDAPAARVRADELRAHTEGDFAPLAALERVRRDPALGSDARAIDALVREAASFPPGPVRVEAWVLAAEAYDRRLGRPLDARPLWRRIATDPHADPVIARKAAKDLVTSLLEAGSVAEAEEAARLGDGDLRRLVARARRRRSLHLACIGVLGVLGVLAGRAVARGGARRLRRTLPIALAFAAYLAITGGALAAGYEGGSAKPFLAFGAALVPVLLAARAAAAVGSPRPLARAGRAILAASGALAAAFLVLEALDVRYLEGVGL